MDSSQLKMKTPIKNILKKIFAIFISFLFTHYKWVPLTINLIINFVKKIIITIKIIILLKHGLIDYIFIILDLFNLEWFILYNKKKKKNKHKTKEINSELLAKVEEELASTASTSKSAETEQPTDKKKINKKTDNEKTDNEENELSNTATATTDYNNLLEKLKQDNEWDENNYNLQLTKTKVWLQQGDLNDIDLWKKKQDYLEGQYADVDNRTIDSRAVAYWGAKECELHIKKLISEGKQPETETIQNDDNDDNDNNDLNNNDTIDNNDWGGGDWD
jgi:hypothetical protein